VSDMAVHAAIVEQDAPAPGGTGSAGIPVVPLRDVVRWAVFVAALLFVLLYLVGLEEGATSIVGSRYLHEFLHDGRHLLAFPCH
jgi:Probable cobalt transporter subunit (CbtB)